ncbi:manganese transporter [Deinococcus radiopugnans]|uniref:Divalent metal cation transporter MntH n=2 Tax=Deinococcus radiopugnans TaxID=57497 RepID=A0A0A7KGZ5_9DEIO|nr:Nramp family divalent metal transporter [Deinococcus radiopugnans]AIZ45401.1 manganese transporter [Deinococcus radiopugnans]MBB6016511.1 manganese transport protein [Deinococcus radiopugnans ATCC 19172]QLG10428.1 Nramp family divalent metal transporter [Deinococcus sp. D7000]TNM71152.1 divalent metal cation transporter [Deinococcus radiopugnans ATCC 19172]
MTTDKGWRQDNLSESLSDVARIKIDYSKPPWRRFLAFLGPGALVAVGYMDPGNWATSIAGGSAYGYTLLSMVLISSLMAIYLQALTARLGIATGRDLAQACRDHFSKPAAMALWISAEIAIIATDLAEVIGTAIALNLLFGLPLLIGVILTVADVLLILLLQNKGFRYVEALVITLIATIAVAFLFEMIFSKPELAPLLGGLVPSRQLLDPAVLYVGIGILGATVMPHNLYLHSAIVNTRGYDKSPAGKREAIKFATWDSSLALTFAFFINASILILAAAAFHFAGRTDIAEIQDAYKLLSPILGAGAASVLFAVALLASGQNSTLTGTLTGQIVMEGFVNIRLKPWVRRLVTRLIAIIPTVIVVMIYGEKGTGQLLILSQVILSMQLSFAVVPLMMFSGDKRKMGEFVINRFWKVVGWAITALIIGLNVFLLAQTFFGS